jgi:hypothetical protein
MDKAAQTIYCEPEVFPLKLTAAIISTICTVICVKYTREKPGVFNCLMLSCAISLALICLISGIGCELNSYGLFMYTGSIIFLPCALYVCLVLYRFFIFADLIWYPKWFMITNMVLVSVEGVAGFFTSIWSAAALSANDDSASIIRPIISIHAALIELITGAISLRILYKIQKNLLKKTDQYNKDLHKDRNGKDTSAYKEMKTKVTICMFCLLGVIGCLILITCSSFTVGYQVGIGMSDLGISLTALFSIIYFRLIVNIAQFGTIKDMMLSPDELSTVKSTNNSTGQVTEA